MDNIIFIDESGDLGCSPKSSPYLIISALIVENSEQLNRFIKNMRRNKFKKELKNASEIKANNSKPNLIKHMLLKLNEIEHAQASHIVLEKKNISSEYLKNDKNKLYNFVAGKLAQNIIFNKNQSISIIIDKSKGKQVLQNDFNGYFTKKLCENSNINKINISHSYSQSYSGLQFVDILAWAVYQKFTYENSEYLDLLTIQQEIIQLYCKK